MLPTIFLIKLIVAKKEKLKSLDKIGCGSAKKSSELVFLLSPFTIFAIMEPKEIQKIFAGHPGVEALMNLEVPAGVEIEIKL